MADTKKKKRASLSSFTILLIILVALAVITVIMAACGVEGIEGATLSGVLTAPVFGFQDAIGVCLFVMILGGFLGIVTETGALDAGIAALVHKLKGNELVLIPILMFIFSIGGTTYGMCEETVPFYLLLAATMVAAGFDSLTGAAVVLLGAGCGVLGSTVNPFAVGVAVDALSGIGIAVNQGIIIALGAILWLTTTIISIIFVMRYAKKVKADKGSTFLSLQEQQDMMNEWGMTDSEAEAADGQEMAPKMTGRQKATLIVFALTFVIMIVSFIPWEDLGFDGFVAGQSYEEVTTTVAGDEVIAAYDEANGTTTEVAAPFEATSVSEEEVTPAWPALHRPVLPDPVLLRHGHRVHAHHGRSGQPAELLGRDHGHDLLRRQRPCEPVHADLRRHHGRLGPRQDRVLDLAQVRREAVRGPRHRLHGDPHGCDAHSARRRGVSPDVRVDGIASCGFPAARRH